jgi:hypothetical protein
LAPADDRAGARRGGTIRVVLVTAGDGYIEAVARDARSASAAAGVHRLRWERLREARAALRLLAGDKARLLLLGFPRRVSTVCCGRTGGEARWKSTTTGAPIRRTPMP